MNWPEIGTSLARWESGKLAEEWHEPISKEILREILINITWAKNSAPSKNSMPLNYDCFCVTCVSVTCWLTTRLEETEVAN